MQSFAVLHALLLLFIVAVHGATSDEDIQLSEAFGGSGGVAFSDIELVEFGQTAHTITINAKERITAVILRVATPAELTFSHGGCSGMDDTLTLEAGEYVNSMEIHWGKKLLSSRIFYLKFGTNKNRTVSGGTATDDKSTITAPKGFQLSGFFGRAEGEVHQLGVIWTRINAKTKALTDTMGTAWYGNRIRNWVGPTIGDAADSACYRKREFYGSGKSCPLGYSANGISCLAQCPIAYPVDCYEECIPQNDDCSGEILSKTASVVSAVFNTVTAGIFGAVFSSYKNAKQSFLCAANIVGVIKSLIYYLRFQRTTAPEGTVEEMLAIAYQSNVVIFDLPIAVANCLGVEVSKTAQFANIVYIVVENIVKQVVVNGDQILSSATNVLALLSNSSAMTSAEDSTVEELQDLLDSNTTCGYQLKNLTDHVISTVRDIRNKTPDATVNDIRIKVSETSIVLRDIPTATNNCLRELLRNKTTETAFETRDLIRRTFGVIVDQLVERNSTDMAQSLAEDAYTLDAANLALVVLGGMDPTGIAWMLSQFVQPTCGPTAFVGEIDDGNLHDALGLKTMDEAFKGSYGTWTKEGDGMMKLLFESTDAKDVTVVIHSGGEVYTKVKVPAGGTVKWTEKLSKMQDKVMYLDRWRASIVGVPMSAGGSLVLWIPRAYDGGHLTMHVRINVS
ncbi:Jacalin-like lectin domain [Phytophthora cactorum]|nr:Jacalin-like lectin domain [Phytophthora cactorum]